MIKNADEARSISPFKDELGWHQAQGYLAALEGPEFKAMHELIDRQGKEIIEWQERYKDLWQKYQGKCL